MGGVKGGQAGGGDPETAELAPDTSWAGWDGSEWTRSDMATLALLCLALGLRAVQGSWWVPLSPGTRGSPRFRLVGPCGDWLLPAPFRGRNGTGCPENKPWSMVTTDMATRELGHIYILSDAGPAEGAGGSGSLPGALTAGPGGLSVAAPGIGTGTGTGTGSGTGTGACVLPGAVHHLQLQQVRAARGGSVTAVVNVGIAMVTRGWQL